ncbi:MAG: tetraacyldisaccharide 4'-kinase [Cyclobacteriaceae bacterium]|jgi:tetraacyldisaccharide 4'-kinase|nr:tetraacyldisaccharide 4'-kinase [Cyclobacteriaceae bacterium]
MSILKVLLFPLAWLFGLVTAVRSWLYQIHVFKQHTFAVPTVCVGNLAVGGTGKTPTIEYLIRLLARDFTVATLSRGYGRATRGFRLANTHDDAQTLGDEPFQFYRNYHPAVYVAVDEHRAHGIATLQQQHPGIQAVLLDDAFQHRAVKPDVSILLTEYHRPFFRDRLMPVGRLREPRSQASRADIILVTKCPPDLSDANREAFAKALAPYLKRDTPIFFSRIAYGAPIGFDGQLCRLDRCVAVSALADGSVFENALKAQATVVRTVRFADHHRYTAAEVDALQRQRPPGARFVTTEKDFVKLIHPSVRPAWQAEHWCYVPITIEILKDGSIFDSMIRAVVAGKSSKSA